MIFLFEVNPFEHDITCNYLNACSLQNLFVWWSGSFAYILHHLHICEFLDLELSHAGVTQRTVQPSACSFYLGSIQYKIRSSINVTRNYQHASLDRDISRFLKLQRPRSNYSHEYRTFKVTLDDAEGTTQLKTLHLKRHTREIWSAVIQHCIIFQAKKGCYLQTFPKHSYKFWWFSFSMLQMIQLLKRYFVLLYFLYTHM